MSTTPPRPSSSHVRTVRQGADVAAELVALCWHLRGPSGRVHTCSIYRPHAPGLLLRISAGADCLKSKRVADIDVARAVADEWLHVLTETKVFEEVTEPVERCCVRNSGAAVGPVR
jgi:hypothetical protein